MCVSVLTYAAQTKHQQKKQTNTTKRNMSTDAAFLALANATVEGEIRAYFPDTALYRRLRWGGWAHAGDYTYREFSPRLVGPIESGVLVTSSSLGEGADSAPGAGLARPKRRRASIVDELQKSLEGFRGTTLAPPQAPLTSSVTPFEESEAVVGAATAALSPALRDGAAPYTVTCHSCTTCVTSTYPCWVLEGYVVLWAESLLEVECVPTKGSVAAPSLAVEDAESQINNDSRVRNTSRSIRRRRVDDCRNSRAVVAPRSTSQPHLSPLPPPLGLRSLLHRISNACAGTPEEFVEDTTAVLAPSPRRSKGASVRPPKQQSTVHEHSTDPCTCAVIAEPATQIVTLHSLHIVRRDAARTAHPASFALQSVLQPGWRTTLECYPRQMIHFGLLVYAAWHASSQTWQQILSGEQAWRDDRFTEADGHVASLPSRGPPRVTISQRTSCKQAVSHPLDAVAAAAAPTSSSSTSEPDRGAYAESLAELLPRTKHDAVLILGLGGNVLGQCLDALLPSEVPLHIVEVEPAVLQACCEHGQFAEMVAVDTRARDINDVSSPKASTSAWVDYRRGHKPCKSEAIAGASPVSTSTDSFTTARSSASLASSVAMQQAADLIRSKSTTPVAFMARRQDAPGLLGALAAQPLNVFRSPTKGAKCQRRSHHASAAAKETPLLVPQVRGEYVCFLQDAYAYLRASAAPVARSTVSQDAAAPHGASETSRGAAPAAASSSLRQGIRTRRGAQSQTGSSSARAAAKVAAAAAAAAEEGSLSPIQYSMIFLDCYDPSKENMLHEETLVELCARRLRPGGVLLVNAHVLPTAENLRSDFFHSRFATVQALRVSGCTQTVVVCVVRDTATQVGSNTVPARLARGAVGDPVLAEKRCRFTLRQIQLLADALNTALHRATNGSSGGTRSVITTGWNKASAGAPIEPALCSSSPSCTSHCFHSKIPAFRFDAGWLKSCRRIVVPLAAGTTGRRGRRASATPSPDSTADFDLHVWQHYF